MTQKFFPKHVNMTPEQTKAYLDEKLKIEKEAAIRHKQLTAIYIDRIDLAFSNTKFKNEDDLVAFNDEHRPNSFVFARDFVSFYDGILKPHQADNESKLVWLFVDRYYQERLELKYKYVRGL